MREAAGRYRSLYLAPREYEFVRPPEIETSQDVHPVVIVGGGPVGLTMALELALFGVPSVVVEASNTESTGSRASCISRRSIEILKRLGISDEFEAEALPWTSGTSFYRGQPIFRLEMPHGADERDFPMANLQQNILERMLIDRIAGTDLVDLRWQQSLIGIEQDADEARLTIESPEGQYELRARYVVAADGAKSAARSLVGLRMAGEVHAARYLIADIQMRSSHPTERRAWFDSPVNRGSTILMHRQPHDIWRVDYQLRDDDDADAEQEPARLKQRIQQVLDMAGETAGWELDWASIYKAYSLCLDTYVEGRVAFIGDAAHLVPIFGVKGLNSGLADANNLGWKLAALVQKRGGPKLLTSFNAERRAATMDIFEAAGKSTRFMTPPTRGYDLMRRACLALALHEPWAGKLADPRQSAPFRYTGSPLNKPDGGSAEAGLLGASAPSVRLDDGWLHDLLDVRPTVIVEGKVFEEASAFAAIENFASDPSLNVIVVNPREDLRAPRGVRVVRDVDAGFARRFHASAGDVFLLRPDWHVSYVANGSDGLKGIPAALRQMWGFDA